MLQLPLHARNHLKFLCMDHTQAHMTYTILRSCFKDNFIPSFRYMAEKVQCWCCHETLLFAINKTQWGSPYYLFFFRTLTKEKFVIMDINFLQHRSIPSENLKAILLSVIISKDRFSVQQVKGEYPQFDRCQPAV